MQLHHDVKTKQQAQRNSVRLLVSLHSSSDLKQQLQQLRDEAPQPVLQFPEKQRTKALKLVSAACWTDVLYHLIHPETSQDQQATSEQNMLHPDPGQVKQTGVT